MIIERFIFVSVATCILRPLYAIKCYNCASPELAGKFYLTNLPYEPPGPSDSRFLKYFYYNCDKDMSGATLTGYETVECTGHCVIYSIVKYDATEEAKLSTTDKSDKTKIPIKRYVVRGCYNQLTGQTPSKFMITTDYCFKSKISTIWNYDGTKPWLLSDGTDPTTTEYIRLCKDNTCNSKSVENGNDPCIAPSTGPPIVVGDTTTSPINTKALTCLQCAPSDNNCKQSGTDGDLSNAATLFCVKYSNNADKSNTYYWKTGTGISLYEGDTCVKINRKEYLGPFLGQTELESTYCVCQSDRCNGADTMQKAVIWFAFLMAAIALANGV